MRTARRRSRPPARSPPLPSPQIATLRARAASGVRSDPPPPAARLRSAASRGPAATSPAGDGAPAGGQAASGDADPREEPVWAERPGTHARARSARGRRRAARGPASRTRAQPRGPCPALAPPVDLGVTSRHFHVPLGGAWRRATGWVRGPVPFPSVRLRPRGLRQGHEDGTGGQSGGGAGRLISWGGASPTAPGAAEPPPRTRCQTPWNPGAGSARAPGTPGAFPQRADTGMIDFPFLFLARGRLHSSPAWIRERHRARTLLSAAEAARGSGVRGGAAACASAFLSGLTLSGWGPSLSTEGLGGCSFRNHGHKDGGGGMAKALGSVCILPRGTPHCDHCPLFRSRSPSAKLLESWHGRPGNLPSALGPWSPLILPGGPAEAPQRPRAE